MLYLEGDASWLRYRISGRCVFQVGGWGDLSAEEYLQGSERIRQYCKKEGLQVSDWRLEDYPLERGPESEWGSEPGLGEALADFCQREGYRFTCISLPETNEFSRLAFKAISALLQKTGQPPAGILVEMFSQFDATAVINSGLLPLWLVFNTWDSLAFLKEMTREFPSGLPVFFSPLSTFSITPDLVPWQSWAEALQDFDWVNIGARRSHYPSDTRALVEGTRMLRNWCAAHPNPLRGRLTGEELKKLS